MGKPSPGIRTVRVYDVTDADEGYRVLVDRLWPRGVSRDSLKLDQWAKELAPGTELRKWFAHDPDKWDEFQQRYRNELSEKTDQLQSLVNAAGERTLLLLYAAKDQQHNHALVLREVLLD